MGSGHISQNCLPARMLNTCHCCAKRAWAWEQGYSLITGMRSAFSVLLMELDGWLISGCCAGYKETTAECTAINLAHLHGGATIVSGITTGGMASILPGQFLTCSD